ncbi:oligosaccharide flippase family protein [Patescibacteria group bacterium]|nr:oligosaccharide flippase family protein [Patescibacteria group bacterium]
MKKSLGKIILVGSGNVINALLGFAFLSVVAKTLDLESFGKYALITTLLVAISKLIDFGTNSVYVAESISKENESLTNLFYTLKTILLGISIPISFIILTLLKLNYGNLVLYFILGLFAYTINYTLNAFFQKDEKFIHLVSLNTIPAIIKGIFAYLIFSGNIKMDMEKAFMVFSLSIFSSVLLVFFLSPKYKKFKLDFSHVKKYLTKSTPAGISQLIYEGWPSIANSIAKIAKDFSNVGIFSIAEKISNVLLLGSISIFTVLLPKNAYAKKRHEKYNFKEVFYISILILIVAFFGIFISRFFISGFFGEKFNESLPLLGFLIFASAFTSIHTFMEHYFFIEEKTNYIMYINAGKLFLFLVLSYILVPTLSLKGLSLSSLVSSISALMFTVFFIRKNQNLSKSV